MSKIKRRIRDTEGSAVLFACLKEHLAMNWSSAMYNNKNDSWMLVSKIVVIFSLKITFTQGRKTTKPKNN